MQQYYGEKWASLLLWPDTLHRSSFWNEVSPKFSVTLNLMCGGGRNWKMCWAQLTITGVRAGSSGSDLWLWRQRGKLV